MQKTFINPGCVRNYDFASVDVTTIQREVVEVLVIGTIAERIL